MVGAFGALAARNFVTKPQVDDSEKRKESKSANQRLYVFRAEREPEMLGQRGKKQKYRAEYATCHDFQQIFTQDMAGLHLLAFLLAADQAKAEQGRTVFCSRTG